MGKAPFKCCCGISASPAIYINYLILADNSLRIIHQFKDKVNLILKEFSTYKRILFGLVRGNNRISMRQAWVHIKQNYELQVPNLILFVYVLLVLPAHTAVVERGFILHKIIKNRFRSRLQVSFLDSVMRVSLGAPPPINTFDINAAARIYQSKPVDGKPSLLWGRLHNAVSSEKR